MAPNPELNQTEAADNLNRSPTRQRRVIQGRGSQSSLSQDNTICPVQNLRKPIELRLLPSSASLRSDYNISLPSYISPGHTGRKRRESLVKIARLWPAITNLPKVSMGERVNGASQIYGTQRRVDTMSFSSRTELIRREESTAMCRPQRNASDGDLNTHIESPPLGGLPLGTLILGICLGVFILSLDRTIITTATPRITDQFGAFEDIGWYGSAYLLAACAFQPLYGRIYQLFNLKYTYMTSLLIFEVGSLLCAIAPSSVVLICGRALSGLGSAGILTGSFVIVSAAVHSDKRPAYVAAVGTVYGTGSAFGPILGGVFTKFVSWRWCFYINLPIGGATIVALYFVFNPSSSFHQSRSVISKIHDLDLVGNILLLVGSIMLFLGLEFTQMGYSWSSLRIVSLLTSSGVIFSLCTVWQSWRGDRALIPPSIIRQRSVLSSCATAFFLYGAMLIHSYYLPMWFQAVNGDDAIESGIHMIPFMVANALLSLIAGVIVSKMGYYQPPAILGCAIAVVGCGLMTTLQLKMPTSAWIGYEIVVSVGFGLAVQQGFSAVQTVLRTDQLPIGTAAIISCQSLGGSVFIFAGNTVLQTNLLHLGSKLSDVDIHAVIRAGASQFREAIPQHALGPMLEVYNESLRRVFTVAIPLAGLSLIAAFLLEWRSIREPVHCERDNFS